MNEYFFSCVPTEIQLEFLLSQGRTWELWCMSVCFFYWADKFEPLLFIKKP